MTTFAPGTELLPAAHARADVSSSPVVLQPASSTSLGSVRDFANTSVPGQRRWRVHVDAGNNAITPARIAEAAQLQEVNQLQLRDVVFGNHPGTSKRLRRTSNS